MSPVEPSPEVIGTIGLPSTECPSIACPDDFVLAACSLGANRLPVAAPRGDKNERRFQPGFKLMRGSLFKSFKHLLGNRRSRGDARRIDNQRAADNLYERVARDPLECHTCA